MTQPLLSGIRTRILLLITLIFVAILVLFLALGIVERQESVAETMNDLQRSAEQMAQEQSEVITQARQVATLLSEKNLVPFLKDPAYCHELLAQWVHDQPGLTSIAIADPRGDISCNSVQAGLTANVSDRDHFQMAQKSMDTVMAQAIYSRLEHKWSLPLAKAIRDDKNRVIGTVIVLVNLQWVGQRLLEGWHPEDSRVGLVDEKGVVIARNPDPDHWAGKSAAETPFFKALMAQHGRGTMESTGFDGVPRIYGLARFNTVPQGNIYLWVGVNRETVVGRIDSKYEWILGGCLLFFGSVFALVWIASERWITRPVRALAEAARRIGHGEYDQPTGFDYERGELGQLAKTMDEMAVSLMSHSEILRLNRALTVLSRCNRVLVHSDNEQQLLSEICRVLVENANYRMVWVGYAEHNPEQSVQPVVTSGYLADYLDNVQISWGDSEYGHGPTGTAIRTGRTQTNQDFPNNPSMKPWRAAAMERGYMSSCALPLGNNNQAFGALTLYSADRYAFNADEVKLLEELAEDVSFGIRMLRVRQANAEWAAKLERSMEGTVEVIATTLEMRDPYTAGHQNRVASLAVAIARELGLPDDEIHGLHLASTIHDIGKIKVPAEILSKPSRLTAIEFELIQEHSRSGYELLKNIDFPWPIAELVYQHHERIDGSGYPRKLQGDQIMIGAKILAVADTVEAMASHRPYRPALGIRAGLKEISENRGKRYDAAVVDACLRLFDEKGFSFP